MGVSYEEWQYDIVGHAAPYGDYLAWKELRAGSPRNTAAPDRRSGKELKAVLSRKLVNWEGLFDKHGREKFEFLHGLIEQIEMQVEERTNKKRLLSLIEQCNAVSKKIDETLAKK